MKKIIINQNKNHKILLKNRYFLLISYYFVVHGISSEFATYAWQANFFVFKMKSHSFFAYFSDIKRSFLIEQLLLKYLN